MRVWMWVLTAVLAGVIGVAWLLRPPPLEVDPAAIDANVEQILGRAQQQDGIEFLSDGGVYADRDPSQKGMDEQVVLPLLKRLDQQLQIRAQAVTPPDAPKMAVFLAVRLPSDPGRVAALKQFFRDEDAAFPGVILHQYGDKWMHFDVLSKAAADKMNIDSWEVR